MTEAADFLQVSFALPTLHRESRTDRERTTVSIPLVPAKNAAVAFTVEPPDWEFQPIAVRTVEGRLFSPMRFLAMISTRVDIQWSEHQFADDFAVTLAARNDGTGWRGLETLLPGKTFGARGRSSLPQAVATAVDASLLRGADLADQMRAAAASDFAVIDGVVHRAVGDPVWVESATVPGHLILTLPTDPDFDGMVRVRHDFPHLAEDLAARRYAADRRRRPFEPERRGRLIDMTADYAPRRDDAACCARDFVRTLCGALLPLLGEGAPRLSELTLSRWFAARDAVEACRDGDAASVGRCLAAGDALGAASTDDMSAEQKRHRTAPGVTTGTVLSRLRKAARDCGLRRRQFGPMEIGREAGAGIGIAP